MSKGAKPIWKNRRARRFVGKCQVLLAGDVAYRTCFLTSLLPVRRISYKVLKVENTLVISFLIGLLKDSHYYLGVIFL
jgi:hypothetical protein